MGSRSRRIIEPRSDSAVRSTAAGLRQSWFDVVINPEEISRVVFLLERLQFREAGSVYGGVRLVAECKVGIAVDLVNTSALSSRQ